MLLPIERVPYDFGATPVTQPADQFSEPLPPWDDDDEVEDCEPEWLMERLDIDGVFE